MISPERRAALEQSYASIRPMIQQVGQNIGAGNTFLDVGSGEGLLTLKMAEDLRSRRVIMIDNENEPDVELPPHAEFHRFDVHSDAFVARFQNKANLIISLTAFHEFEHPAVAAANLIRIVPIEGVIIVFDYTEQGWERQRLMSARGDLRTQIYSWEDMWKLMHSGLGTDKGIREFWEEYLSPRAPGIFLLTFQGDLYSMIYLPRQWGEVKQPPPEVR